MDLSLPIREAILAGVKKTPTNDQKRAYAAGVLAHLAIQVAYRLQHPDHLVVCERKVTFGDQKLATISKFGELLLNGTNIVLLAAKNSSRPVPNKVLKALRSNDLWALLIYILDESTTKFKKKGRRKIRKKRLDIIDFGPLERSDSIAVEGALAYEIKPKGDLLKGAMYIRNAVKAFNLTMKSLAPNLEKAFNVKGLRNYKARPGTTWPPFPYLFPIGSNMLLFYNAGQVSKSGEGVIVYEWIKFRRISLKRLWDSVKKVSDEVRDLLKKDKRIGNDVKAVVFGLGAIAVLSIGIIAVAGAEASAGIALEVGVSSTAISGGRQLFARLLVGGSLVAPNLSRAGEQTQNNTLFDSDDPLLKAVADASDPDNMASVIDSGKLPQGREQPSGGTGSTEFEEAVAKLADAIAQQYVSLYAVKTGQGSDLLDDESTQFIKVVVSNWLNKFISQYGSEQFLNLFGVERLDEESAMEIALFIIDNAQIFIRQETYGSIVAELLTMTVEEVLDSLPDYFDGFIPEDPDEDDGDEDDFEFPEE